MRTVAMTLVMLIAATLAGGILVGGIVVGDALVAAPGRPETKPRRARPPKWDEQAKSAFFDDASKALVGSRPIFDSGSGATNAGSARGTPDNPGSGDGPAAGSYAWSKIISAETIEDEVKTLAKALDASVTTPQKYAGGDYKVGQLQFSVAAVLFGIVAEYDGQVRWKKQAAAARDLFAQAGFGSRVGSIQAFNQAKAAKAALAELVSGSTIQAKESEAKPKWDKVAYRPPLMQRLKQAQEDHLQPWTANPAEFKKHADEIVHEAELLAALGDVIGRDGYEFADDADYLKHARNLKASGLAVLESIKLKNADGARTAVGQIGKTCTACHESFRGQ